MIISIIVMTCVYCNQKLETPHHFGPLLSPSLSNLGVFHFEFKMVQFVSLCTKSLWKG